MVNFCFMKLYNTLTEKIETFTLLEKNIVKLYVCGITPYDTTHLGHAFTYTIFDVLYRFLEFQGHKVNYTQNVTDIDDDILKKANENHLHSRDLSSKVPRKWKSGNPALSDKDRKLVIFWT